MIKHNDWFHLLIVFIHVYCLGSKTGWKLSNIKEEDSLNNEALFKMLLLCVSHILLASVYFLFDCCLRNVAVVLGLLFFCIHWKRPIEILKVFETLIDTYWVWNSLPTFLRAVESLTKLKKDLKTLLFKESFWQWLTRNADTLIILWWKCRFLILNGVV